MQIDETRTKLKEAQVKVISLEKTLAAKTIELSHIETDIVRNDELFRRAFVYTLKTMYDNDIDQMFRENLSQESIVAIYTHARTQEGLMVVLMHLWQRSDSWFDIIKICNLAMTCKNFYYGILRFVPARPQEEQTKVPSCIIHLYPITKIYEHITQGYSVLRDQKTYGITTAMMADNIDVLTSTCKNIIFRHKKWVFVLLKYWLVRREDIPNVPDDIPKFVQMRIKFADQPLPIRFRSPF